ncbi:MAG: polyphosphate kinase 1 [Flavobacteriales bacterium]|nr:polyphosphate kinase 1 [Flavobacteriales bacterium]
MQRSDPEVLERAHLHVRRWFAQRMSKRMRFHDLEHTLTVTRTAIAIGRAMRISGADLFALELAALFHDTGYALAYEGHEEESAELAEAFLAKQAVSITTRRKVRSLIMATRMKSRVRGTLQAILRDADSAKAGQADFEERGELLRQELEFVKGLRISERQWIRTNLAYLEAHVFHTVHARRRYSAQKRINLGQLRLKAAQPKALLATRPLPQDRYFERDLSWLSFNDRVLQEAKDARNPLLERVKFLAIYSSNLDEFYRVRVASLRGLAKLKKTVRTALEVPAAKLIDRINKKALGQQREFGHLWRNTLLPALRRKGIRILRGEELDATQVRHVQRFYAEHIAPRLSTANVRAGNAPFIEDRKLYFVCRLRRTGKGLQKERLVLVNIPSDELGRFIRLPAPAGRTDIIFLDDAMRLCLDDLFTGHRITGCHAIKLSRDAELYLDEEFVGNVKDKVRKSLRKRQTGVPSRFLYDGSMPGATVRALRSLLGLSKPDMVRGGRYHHFSDLMKLPVKGHVALRDKPWVPLTHPPGTSGRNLFNVVTRKDLLLHTPYQSFDVFTNWLQRTARDRTVKRISITLYRVAEASTVCSALLEALRHGKRVTVFVEVQARFDERTNLYWGELLEKAGARVLYSYENLKVHCKLCSIERVEKGRVRRYAYLGTGNFNERTARTYADTALITKREAITREVAEVFAHLEDRKHRPALSHLLMAPLFLRSGMEALIDKEIEHASLGLPASILLKLNSLEDRALIAKLYDASRAGVSVRVIARGICCLVPKVKGSSERIEAISIVDRYLEHARAFVFHNNGDPLVFLSSADWMGRNLDRRVEVAFPLLDPDLRDEMIDLLEIQWNDNTKARIINAAQDNVYRRKRGPVKAVHAQRDSYVYLRKRIKRA